MTLCFLDVGAHEGQTLAEVTKPSYRFDRIYAFEPMPAQFRTLRERYATEATLLNCGLASRPGERLMYGSNGEMEASLYPKKRDTDADVVTRCAFLDVADWFLSYVPDAQSAVVKLNCEGAEVEILDRLLDSGQIAKVAEVMIDFDVRKIPGMESEEARIIERFQRAGFDRFALSEAVMVGETHQERIAHWLRGVVGAT